MIVDEKYKLKIVDFGLSRSYDDELLEWTQYVVTRYYRAPEIVLEMDYGVQGIYIPLQF